jgi:four helix bundle protein
MQIRRSTISVPSNIAEGYGRQQAAGYIRFLQISGGSLFELITQFKIALKSGYIPENYLIQKESIELSKMHNKLISGIKNSNLRK